MVNEEKVLNDALGNNRVSTYKDICHELYERPTPWLTLSDDATMLDEIMIHTKKEDLRPVQKDFAVKLIKRLLVKFDLIHILTEDSYEDFGFFPSDNNVIPYDRSI